jgi:hypothetical protein
MSGARSLSSQISMVTVLFVDASRGRGGAGKGKKPLPYILITLPEGSRTLVFAVDPILGGLSFTGITGYDAFESKQDAIDFLTMGGPPEGRVDGACVLGYRLARGCGVLVVAKRVQPLFSLFDRHTIWNLLDVDFVEFPTRFDSGALPPVEKLRHYPFCSGHFFCLTYDLRDLLGPNATNLQCFWNEAMRQHFAHFGVANVCPGLLQGVASSYDIRGSANARLLLFEYRTLPDPSVFGRGGFQRGHLASSRAHEIAAIVMRRRDFGFRCVRYRLQLGDVPFGWVLSRAGKVEVLDDFEATSASFVELAKRTNDVREFGWISQLDPADAELAGALNRVIAALPEFTSLVVDAKLFESLAGEMHAVIMSAINQYLADFVASETYFEEGHPPIVAANQVRLYRYTIGQRFDAGIVSLFCFLRNVCEHLLGDVEAPGFTQMLAEFVGQVADLLLCFDFVGISQSAVSQISQGPLPTLGARALPKQQVQDAFRTAVSVTPPLFCVTHSHAAFVLSGRAELMSVSPVKEPIAVRLSEACFVREIVVRRPSGGLEMSVSGGLWLNRMFQICSDVVVPGAELARVSLAPSTFYDQDFRLMDSQPVRYLVFQFRSLADDATIAGLHISGVPWVEQGLDLSQCRPPPVAVNPSATKAR